MDGFKIVLASKSPRRQDLIKELGFPFEIRTKEVEEIFPPTLPAHEVPTYLATLKSTPLRSTLGSNEVLLTSDTVVILNGQILGKPKNREEAIDMLSSLSNTTHEVITGVSLVSNDKEVVFSSKTLVHFSALSFDQIDYYITKYQPFDKAGSYGIQEWIGYIGVKKIEGCYYNVMGLPIHDVYRNLINHFNG